MDKLIDLINDSEDILIDKILKYAIELDYAKYTSTLKEAWRLSISGLSSAMIQVIKAGNTAPEMSPDMDYRQSEIAAFGISEARLHRSRGITLGMFLSFMKYYRQCYEDIVHESECTQEQKDSFLYFIKRYFDFVELGFTLEWTGATEADKLVQLQTRNRMIQNEKNKYLTVFESIYDAAIIVDKNNNVDNINVKAAELFCDTQVSGSPYYGNDAQRQQLSYVLDMIGIDPQNTEDKIIEEKTIKTRRGVKTFTIKTRKLLDVSEKFLGKVIVLTDITERKKLENEILIMNKRLQVMSVTDELTGIYNRRKITEVINDYIAKSKRYGKNFCVAILDIDHFKTVNDQYGHNVGDAVLCTLTTEIKNMLRSTDVFGRWGGEEFIVVVPNCTADGAYQFVERIRTAVNDSVFPSVGTITVSAGISAYSNDETFSKLIEKADAALYDAKNTGRNRSIIYAQKV